jgi:2,3-bisphosphoglycerate-independent phosphoglycerate mutase
MGPGGAGPLLLLFLDGVGIGEENPDHNPFFRAELPTLRKLFGGTLPSLEDPCPGGALGRAFPLDANLGVLGLPQSGTGQVTLLTGENAPVLFGGHFGPWPPSSLRPLLHERNLLRRASEAGHRVIFANAYPAGWPGDLPSRRLAAPPLAAQAAGILTLDQDALAREEAVASEIVNDGWRRYTGRSDIPLITPERAGQTLARLAGEADLTFFAHYHTDHAGHRGGMEGAVTALERVDAFLAGILVGAPPGLRVLGVSDHGNIEDVRVGHTRNPALGFSFQIGGGETLVPFAPGLRHSGADLTHVTPAVLEALDPMVLPQAPPQTGG